MALATTTLSSACAAADTQIVVASATSVAAERIIIIDGEQMQVTRAYVAASTTVPVRRGLGGTKVSAHVSGAYVTHGAASDFTAIATGQGVNWPPAGRTRNVVSYTAAGAITLPVAGEDLVVILNGTVAADFTIADPTKDLNGSIVYIGAGGAAAFTVTAAGGFGAGGSSYDKLTFAAGAQVAIWMIAIDGAWLIPNSPAIAGTVTNLLATIG